MKKVIWNFIASLIVICSAVCLCSLKCRAFMGKTETISVQSAQKISTPVEIKQTKRKLEKDIFEHLQEKRISVEKYGLSKKRAVEMIEEILEKNHCSALVDITLMTNDDGTVTSMKVEADDAFASAVQEIEEMNENQEQPLCDDEMQEVVAHYAELQTFYESNPDYFGIPVPFFSDKNTEETPVGAIMYLAQMDGDNVDLDDLDTVITGTTEGLKYYVSQYGEKLLEEKEKAMAGLDSSMTDLEKYLVLHDYVANQCEFNFDYRIDGSDSLLESTPFGAVVCKSAVCLGYTSTYTYLIQCAFPEIYKNEDGSWKTKEEVKDTYIIDYGNIVKKEAPHYYNLVKLDDKWYYVDVCFDDIVVENQQEIRIQTDGNCYHNYFLISTEEFLGNYNLSEENLDNRYKDLCTNTQYENAWFSNIKTPISFNDDYCFYVESPVDFREKAGSTDFIDKKDQLKMRSRSTGEVIVLIDYATGSVYSVHSRKQSFNETIKNEYENDLFYNKIYPGMQHSVGLYNNILYFNLGNKIYQYCLIDGVIDVVKEYNTVYARIDSKESFKGDSFYAVSEDSEEKEFSVWDHPVASLAIKNDGKMYVSIATNYSNSTKKIYTKEEVNYKPYYTRFGEIHQSGKGFERCANIKETLDMEHFSSGSHKYKKVTVEPGCRSEGFSQFRCEECGRVYGEKKDLKNPVEHHYVYNKEKKIYACTMCNGVTDSAYEHNYGEPDFSLSKKGTKYSCQAVFTCSTCGEKHTEECSLEEPEMVKEPTCTIEGKARYTAYCNFQEEAYLYQEVVKVDPIGHSYGEPEFVWAQDSGSCKAHFQCKICQGQNGDKKEVNCTILTEITQADYGKEGKKICTATCMFEGKKYINTKTESISALIVETTLKQRSYSIYPTQIQRLVLESNWTEEGIKTIQSSDEKVVRVNRDGEFKGVRAGKARVTIMTVSGKKLTATITVKTPKVYLNASVVPLQKGKSTTSVQIRRKINTDSIRAWRSSNSKVASVTQKGKITGKKNGTATITVIMKSGATASCKIKVQSASVKLKKITVDKTSMILGISKKYKYAQLSVTKNPVTATNRVTYQSTNKRVVTVNGIGKVTALRPGIAYITVKCGSQSKKVKVTVKKK